MNYGFSFGSGAGSPDSSTGFIVQFSFHFSTVQSVYLTCIVSCYVSFWTLVQPAT